MFQYWCNIANRGIFIGNLLQVIKSLNNEPASSTAPRVASTFAGRGAASAASIRLHATFFFHCFFCSRRTWPACGKLVRSTHQVLSPFSFLQKFLFDVETYLVRHSSSGGGRGGNNCSKAEETSTTPTFIPQGASKIAPN